MADKDKRFDDVDDVDDEEAEDQLRREIEGVAAPTIDLSIVGISRDLAMVLGTKGTRDLIRNALHRGIGRVLHPDVSNVEGAAESYTAINAAITSINTLSDEEWAEVYRRYVTKRDPILAQLDMLTGSLAREKELHLAADHMVARLQAKLDRLAVSSSVSAASDMVNSLLLSGCSEPPRQLAENGDNDLHVSQLLRCLIITGGHLHFVRRPHMLRTMPIDPAVDERLYLQDEANKYPRRDEESVFRLDTSRTTLPTIVAGDYVGSELQRPTSDAGIVVAAEDLPNILANTRPEIGIQSQLLVISPIVTGKEMAGVMVQLFGPVVSILGPYYIKQKRVTGPLID